MDSGTPAIVGFCTLTGIISLAMTMNKKSESNKKSIIRRTAIIILDIILTMSIILPVSNDGAVLGFYYTLVLLPAIILTINNFRLLNKI